ncbi:LAMI_0F09120g1_1 [Lachancea mirantina]|uniref:Clathrin light chain n=1 Tax=Lachancea mirantina TaxID=1230905 RepID=A0A1G4K136_9SACH|nr:LAMI_0F09120g1_1 [Lachancea mirantina]
MSDKFPPLEDEQFNADAVESNEETDFLKREAELLGDEFKTEEDSEFLQQDKDNEIEDFERTYPEVSNVQAHGEVDADANESEFDDFGEPQTATKEASRGTAVAQWQEKRATEIAEKDIAEENAKKELQEKAAKHLDDFYENYNEKKQQQLKAYREEAQELLHRRDEFFAQYNTVWDRVFELINVDDADIVGDRNRSKFKEILLRLKGNPKAPGAVSTS